MLTRWMTDGGYGFKVKGAVSFFPRLRGLMLEPSLPQGEALFLEPCNSIHMCFMLFDIDAVFISRVKGGYVVEKVVRGLRPWVGFASCFDAEAVLEFRSGEAERMGIIKGSRLSPVES